MQMRRCREESLEGSSENIYFLVVFKIQHLVCVGLSEEGKILKMLLLLEVGRQCN